MEYIECLNCGRKIKNPRSNQKFCKTSPGETSCHDHYWSRGTRRVSKMNIKLNSLIDLTQEMVELIRSNQSRIARLENK